MRTSITASALVLLAATKHVDAFAPAPSNMLRTATVQQQAKFSSVRLFDKPVMKNELEMMMQPGFIDEEERKSTDPTPFFVSLFQNMTKDNPANLKMATAAMVFALMLVPLPSEAAMSGGRMGGSFSGSRSRSMPSSRSYGGGGGGGYSRGYTGGSYYSRPNVIVAPMVSPFGYGGGGYYGGAGALSYSRGPSFSSLLLLGGFMFAVSTVMRGAGNMVESSFEGGGSSFLGSNTMSSLGPGTSVVQLSVAMEVSDRDDPNSILGALARLSKTASTDSRVGVSNLTSQVALEILRRRSSIVSASGNSKHFGDRTKAQREYQSRSIQERAKFESESVSKYGGVDYSSDNNSGNGSSLSAKATMAVLTLVLAIDGDSTKVPTINSMTDVESALQRIASDAKVDDCLQSAEILWTPEDRSETLSLRDVVADYPELRSI